MIAAVAKQGPIYIRATKKLKLTESFGESEDEDNKKVWSVVRLIIPLQIVSYKTYQLFLAVSNSWSSGTG